LSPAAPRRGWIRPPLALAAAVVLAAIGAYWLWPPQPGISPLPAPDGPSLTRGSQTPAASLLVQPPDGARLGSAPPELVWPAQPAASAYRVSLLDARLQVVWRSPSLEGPRARLPEDVRSRLAAGQDYYWSVEPLGSGRRLGPFAFRLEPAR
jgi:hypothetical protein